MRVPTPEQVLELAVEYFEGVGIDVTATGAGLVTTGGRVFGLEPLRRRMAAVPADEWTALVRNQFDLLLGVDPVMPASFEAARPRLRSAVVSADDLGMFEGALMERPLVDGLGERLMLRQGELGMTVTAEAVAGWGVATGVVWEAARNGSIWDEAVHREQFWAEPSTRFTAIRGGRWTSTRILDLDRYLDPRSRYGAIAAVPARDEVLFHQIDDESFPLAAVGMLRHAVESYSTSPLPVGCDLFFWNGQKLWRIATTESERFVYLRVPEFSETLWRLERDLEGRCERGRRAGA